MDTRVSGNEQIFCYDQFKEGTKREECAREDLIKVFDFADVDGDGILKGEEVTRAYNTNGHYPGEKISDQYMVNNDMVNTYYDKDGNGEISKEELEERMEIQNKYSQLMREYKEKRREVYYGSQPYEGDIALGVLGTFAAYVGKNIPKWGEKYRMPSSQQYAKAGIVLKNPKYHNFINSLACGKPAKIFGKFMLGFGLLGAAVGISDFVLGKISDYKLEKVKNEYSNKFNKLAEEYPNNDYAKELSHRY